MDTIAQPSIDLPPVMTLERFRDLVYKGGDQDPNRQLVCRDFEGDRLTVKATSKSDEFEFVASTESVDRDQDTIKSSGFDLRAYRKAPVWLAFHDPREWIGVAVKVATEGERFFNTLKLGPGRMAQFVKEMIEFRLETKALKDAGASCSVGFLPTKFERAPEDSGRRFGIDFLKQELLETSHVPIGSNRDAVLRAKSAGIDHSAVGDWAARYRQLESGLLMIDLSTADAIVKALDPSKGMTLFHMHPDEIAKISTPTERGGDPASKSADFGEFLEKQDRLISTLSDLVKTLSEKPTAVASAEAVIDSALLEAAQEKFKEEYILQRTEDEIVRRTGVLPNP